MIYTHIKFLDEIQLLAVLSVNPFSHISCNFCHAYESICFRLWSTFLFDGVPCANGPRFVSDTHYLTFKLSVRNFYHLSSLRSFSFTIASVGFLFLMQSCSVAKAVLTVRTKTVIQLSVLVSFPLAGIL